MNIEIKGSLDNEYPWLIIIGNTSIKVTYNDLMSLAIQLIDVKNQTTVTPLRKRD